MDEYLLGHQSEIYSGAFFAALILAAIWEAVAPRREIGARLRRRWRANISLAFLNFTILYLVFPIAAVGFSIFIESRGGGILRWFDSPFWLAATVGYLAVDLARYTQHYMLHRLSFLWRFHRIHHSDPDLDFTDGLRFHPVEAVFTVTFVFAAIALVGPPPIAVLAAEICAAASGMLVHANGRVGDRVERYARLWLVTPDMHRIHHSVVRREHNSNFSVVHSFWDRLFGTWLAFPADPPETMAFGLSEQGDGDCPGLRWMLVSPFRNIRTSRETPNTNSSEKRLSD